jgi:N6-L-threonylcarbamoyladenine synthase
MIKKRPVVLAIDTSCDETSVAVTRGTVILSNVVASQVELHRPYGGVFPTVAKQAHRENMAPALAQALKRAKISPAELDAVAVTVGPGLAPALEVGIQAAQAFAKLHNKPLIAANHLEGHICSVIAQPNSRTEHTSTKYSKPANDPTVFPILAIIVSGGNTLFVEVDIPSHQSGTFNSAVDSTDKYHDTKLERQPHLTLDTPVDQTAWQPTFAYTILGRTLDDAAGECLDKVGRMLNLGYPAGPVIEVFAKQGDQNRYPFPLPLTHTKTFDLSFSGIKTHSRNVLTELGGVEALSKKDIYDFCASLQQAVFRHISYKLEKLLLESNKKYHEVWLSGGVAANMALRKTVRQTLKNYFIQRKLPAIRVRTPYTSTLCGDNAAMIGVVHQQLAK